MAVASSTVNPQVAWAMRQGSRIDLIVYACVVDHGVLANVSHL